MFVADPNEDLNEGCRRGTNLIWCENETCALEVNSPAVASFQET